MLGIQLQPVNLPSPASHLSDTYAANKASIHISDVTSKHESHSLVLSSSYCCIVLYGGHGDDHGW